MDNDKIKTGEWYSVGISSVVYSVPWNSEEPYRTTEIGSGTPFLVISVDSFMAANNKKALDLKVLVNGNLRWISPNEEDLNKMSRLT
jgi:hypothetical protein